MRLTIEAADRLSEIAGHLGMTPEALLGRMVERLVEVDWAYRAQGLPRLGQWLPPNEAGHLFDLESVVAGGSVRINSVSTWPQDKPLPWTGDECKAAVLGHAVRWRGSLDEFLALPGKWELSDGYASLWQP